MATGERRLFLPHSAVTALKRPASLTGPINGVKFITYVLHFLLLSLKAGDVVVMDNLGSHKCKGVRQAIRSIGAKLLFLPPYSPDLNPIEQVFAKRGD